MESTQGTGPGGKFWRFVMSDWFEVVERWTDARGEREMILFCGPLKKCQELAKWGSGDMIIRPITF